MQFAQRTARIRDTLAKLELLDYNNKNHRREIGALLHELLGQLTPLTAKYTDLQRVTNRVQDLLDERDGTARLSEGIKRQLVHETRGVLEAQGFVGHEQVMRHGD